MRVLALTKYPRMGASSRLRTFQYLPFLKDQGIEMVPVPFVDEDYLRSLYGKSSAHTAYPSYFRRRIAALRSAREFDAVWMEKEALPWVPWAVERQIFPRDVPLVLDIDDAIFHRYDRHRLAPVRQLLGTKIDSVMARAQTVVAGNTYLADRARAAGARHIEIVPTVVDLERYAVRRETRRGPAVVGWIGSPTTVPYLRLVTDALRPLAESGKARFVAIGARPDQVAGTPFEAVEWSEAAEVGLIQGLDVGIMPLPDDDWARGKCAYKLVQYMACGLPVVASPVGANREVVADGVSGFLAGDADGWRDSVARLVDSPELRTRMGDVGRRTVEEGYSVQGVVSRMADLIREAAARKP